MANRYGGDIGRRDREGFENKGTVENRNEKTLPEDIAEDISGLKKVENRLRASGSQNHGQGSSANSTRRDSTSGITEPATETTTGSTSTSTGNQTKGKSSSGS